MQVEELMDFCAGLPGAWPDNPWDHEHPVFKVGPAERGKIFAFCGADSVGLKCGATREEADEWLHLHPDDVTVTGYIGRSGWNDLALAGGIGAEEILEAVAASYATVVAKLPKKLRPEGWADVGRGPVQGR